MPRTSTMQALALGLAVALAPIGGPAAALTPPRTLGEVITRADVIVHGRVLETESRWADDERGRHIYTTATVERLATLRGAISDPQLMIEFDGGTVDGITERVSDAVSVRTGEEVVLLLDGRTLRPAVGVDSKFSVRGGVAFGREGALPLERLRRAIEACGAGAGECVGEGEPAAPDAASAAGAAPSISSISPASASAGTGAAVTVYGSGFGATQGQGVVEFFYASGQPKIAAPVISWTEAAITVVTPVDDVDGYPASASSGPVTVRTGDGVSNGRPFTVTFGYGGVKWPGTPVGFWINANTDDCSGEDQAVRRAAETWSAAGSLFTFEDRGQSAATRASRNSKNEIMWGATTDSLASTYLWYDSDDTLLECDIVFNDSYAWNAAAPIQGQFDVESIALHELGHWLNLRDLYGSLGDGLNDQGKVMYGYASSGSTKRTLSEADQAGIQWIYGTGQRYTHYRDADADGLGDPADTTVTGSPTPPSGYVTNGLDNCPAIYNPDQADADGDGLGNACEAGVAADPNHSGRMDGFDLGQLGRAFARQCGAPGFDAAVDFDFDCEVDGEDLSYLASYFGQVAMGGP